MTLMGTPASLSLSPSECLSSFMTTSSHRGSEEMRARDRQTVRERDRGEEGGKLMVQKMASRKRAERQTGMFAAARGSFLRKYPCTRLYSVHQPCKQCLNSICFYSLRRVYVVNKEICVRTVCAHEELLRGERVFVVSPRSSTEYRYITCSLSLCSGSVSRSVFPLQCSCAQRPVWGDGRQLR
uniref:Microfibril associated protein 2 n=1 Tax=Sinocyclocheilus anshuiensis TaxID=1608454 RepID=A0A671LXU9_9TELE